MSKSYYFKHKKSVITIFLIGIIFCTILTFLHSSFRDVTEKVYPELYALNIIPKPETFTELYFEDHENLPIEVLPQQSYVFSFTIHNVEYRNMTYPYQTYLLTNNKKTLLQEGNVSLGQNQRKTIQVQISSESAFPKSQIIVDLPKKKQSIDFWVNE